MFSDHKKTASNKKNDGETFGYDGGHDVYVSDADAGPSAGFSTTRTGIFIDGLRGKITGSEYNDIISIRGADKIPEALKKQYPWLEKRIAGISKDDPEYATVVDGGQGNNMVLVDGNGDVAAMGVSFFYSSGGQNSDEYYIGTIGEPKLDNDGDFDRKKNPAVFVNVASGRATLYNPLEYNEADDSKNPVDLVEGDDDYEGNITFGNPNMDLDVPEGQRGGTGFDETALREQFSNMSSEIQEAIARLPEPDDVEIQAVLNDWEEEFGGPAAEMDQEMDSFFDSFFSDFNTFMGEWEQA